MTVTRSQVVTVICVITVALLFAGCLFVGSVHIPAREVLASLTGSVDGNMAWSVIVCEARLPMAITAALAGAALAVSGLLLQTTFNNPLAGPSILGISAGASLGVAIMVLGVGIGGAAASVFGALIGAGVVLLLLLMFARIVRSTAMLLIVGIMVGYFASSGISLLNFFTTHEGAVGAYVVWGLGNFSSVSTETLSIYSVPILAGLGLATLLVKPLDAMLLGERYARSIGVDVQRTRACMIGLSGLLTAFVTAFCGPIGFVGLIVPHIARMATGTSRHAVLMPVAILAGASTGLLCAFVSVLPSVGVLPINAITPVIGVPVVLYIILWRKHLHYFN